MEIRGRGIETIFRKLIQINRSGRLRTEMEQWCKKSSTAAHKTELIIKYILKQPNPKFFIVFFLKIVYKIQSKDLSAKPTVRLAKLMKLLILNICNKKAKKWRNTIYLKPFFKTYERFPKKDQYFAVSVVLLLVVSRERFQNFSKNLLRM